jgi:hypothetical protein
MQAAQDTENRPLKSIRLSEALSIMQNRTVPFSLSFYTYNQKTGSTGELIKLDKVVRCGLPYADRMDDMGLIGVKKIDDSGHPYAVHTWLIDEFNKKKVWV